MDLTVFCLVLFYGLSITTEAAKKYCENGAKDERCLYVDLFGVEDDRYRYNPHVRPSSSYEEPIDVELEYEMIGLKGFDEVQQVVETVGFVVATWTDAHLTWDPKEYQDIKNIVVPPTAVWVPDIGMINSVDSFYQQTFFNYFRVDIQHDGRMIWSFGGPFKTTCELNMRAYPFDTQTCDIDVENWAYTKAAVNLRSANDSINLENMQESGAWTIIGTEVRVHEFELDTHPHEFFPRVSFRFMVRRKWLYYGLNIITPSVFITVCAFLVFWLPAESGEKVSLGITVLLAFSVFQLIVAEHTPKTSDNTPVLSEFLGFVMGMATVSTMIAILILYIHHKGTTTRVPKSIRRGLRLVAKIFCMHNHVPDSIDKEELIEVILHAEDMASAQDVPNAVNTANANAVGAKGVTDLIGKDGESYNGMTKLISLEQDVRDIAKVAKMFSLRAQRQETTNIILEEWKCLSRLVDRIFFWAMAVCLVISCAIIFTHAQ